MRKVVETQFDTFKEVVPCIAVMVHEFVPSAELHLQYRLLNGVDGAPEPSLFSACR